MEARYFQFGHLQNIEFLLVHYVINIFEQLAISIYFL